MAAAMQWLFFFINHPLFRSSGVVWMGLKE